MINHCALAGNLTRDVDLKQTQNGTSILNFGIAVNERVKNGQTGEWNDRPNFFNCVCFGKRAEGLAKVLSKGMKVAIVGHLRYNQWENENGEKRSNVEIVVEDVEFMSQRMDGAHAQQQGYQQPQQAYGQPQQYAQQGYQGGYQQQGYQQAPYQQGYAQSFQ